MNDLGSLNFQKSIALGINEKGHVVGLVDDEPSDAKLGGGSQAFLWTRAGGMKILDDLGEPPTYAKAINDDDLIVGASTPTPLDPAGMRAVVWNNGTVASLEERLKAGQGKWLLMRANGINSIGQIVGSGINPAGEVRGWIVTPDVRVVSENIELPIFVEVPAIVAAGGKGIEIHPDGTIVLIPAPRPDPSPFRISSPVQDVMIALALFAAASRISRIETRQELQKAALRATIGQIELELRSLGTAAGH